MPSNTHWIKAGKPVFRFSVLLVLLALPGGAFAQEERAGEKVQDSDWQDWSVRISPNFWFIGFQGDIVRPPVPTPLPEPPPKYEIDVGFQDIRSSIKFALMLAGRYERERIVSQFNFSSLVLEGEAITPLELILQNSVINLTYVGGDVSAGYRIIRKPELDLDALVGAKYVYFGIGLKTELGGSVPIQDERSQLWIDPLVGASLTYRPHRRLELLGYADIDPRIPDDVRSYQALTEASYLFTKSFLVTLGYRTYHLSVPNEDAIFVGDVRGWLMKVSFRF
jgi:hypothetical protein